MAVVMSAAQGHRSARRSRRRRPPRARRPATESRRSRSRFGSRRRACPVRAMSWVQASSSQARATISHQAWFWAKPLSGRLRSPVSLAQRIRSSQAAGRRGQPFQEPVRPAAGVGADQHLAPQVTWQPGQGQPGRLDMVGGRVRPSASRPQHDGQRLSAPAGAVVGEGGHGMEAERLLPRGRGLLLFRVGDHDRGVQVDGGQPAASARRRVPGQRPCPLPGRGPGRPDGPQRLRQVPGQLADQPGHHRVGRDRPRKLRLLPQHRDVGQAVPAQGDRGSEVRDDLPRVVDRPRRPPPGKPLRQSPAQPGHPHRLPQQDGPGLRDQARAVRRYRHPGSTCAIVHSKSAFGSLADKIFDKPYPSRSKALFHASDQPVTNPDESPRLGHEGADCRQLAVPPTAADLMLADVGTSGRDLRNAPPEGHAGPG